MRRLLLLTLLALPVALCASNFTIVLQAPAYSGQVVRLYRYDDLYTLRTVRIAEMPIGDDGITTLAADVQGVTKLQLRIGDVSGDLFARPGTTLNILFPRPTIRTARSLGTTTRVDLEFHDIDAMDINALATDLNERVDAFIAEDLATDQAAGMQAVGVRRSSDTPPDTTAPTRPGTLFVTPVLSQARTDSFELKLRRFYAEVNDPWFTHYLDNSMAGLHQGTHVNDKTTYERWIKGRPMHYDDPEQVRFLRSFFADLLPTYVVRYHEASLQRALAEHNVDSLKALFATNDLLKESDRLCELMAMDQLYLNFHAKYLNKAAVKQMLTKWSTSSVYPEHRLIAANMLWDRTTMLPGSRMPAMLLENERGQQVDLDSLLNGPVCVVITASWCTYCELELSGLEQLHQTYKEHVRIITISLDSTLTALRTYRKAHPEQDFVWLHAQAEQQLREDLRLRSLPTVYMLNDGVLAHSPAPVPSKGLGALFQQVKTAAERDSREKVWDD